MHLKNAGYGRAVACILAAALLMSAAACRGSEALLEDGTVSDAAAVDSDSVQKEEPQTEETSGEAVANGAGAYTVAADTSESGNAYASDSADENALRVENGCTADVSGAAVEKTGDSPNGDNSARYGLDAAVLIFDGAAFTLRDSNVTSDASGADGVFAYGAGTSLTLDDTAVRTVGESSRGVTAAAGAFLQASGLVVTTRGVSAAAIRCESGGAMTFAGGTYLTGGAESPAVSSAGSVTVSDATLRANGSEAIAIESGGSVMLEDCAVSSGASPVVAFCQSATGECEAFRMSGGSLCGNGGDLFLVTDTNCSVALEGVTLARQDGILLRVRGGTCSFACSGQALDGEILTNEDSQLDLSLANGSSFVGTVNPDGAAGEVSVTLDDTSTWSLTGNAYISSFTGSVKNVVANGYAVYVDGKAITK